MRVVGARDLPKADVFGTVDPYVVLTARYRLILHTKPETLNLRILSCCPDGLAKAQSDNH